MSFCSSLHWQRGGVRNTHGLRQRGTGEARGGEERKERQGRDSGVREREEREDRERLMLPVQCRKEKSKRCVR